MPDFTPEIPHIFIVSGGKGLAGDYVVKSLLVQYPDFNIPSTIISDILTSEDALRVVLLAREKNGIIVHTMVDKKMRISLCKLCREHNVPAFDLMGDLADFLTGKLGIEPISQPGLYRKMNQEYFDRVAAIEFTLATDDGLNPQKINKADIILTGISRTGKTPLSVYLAMFGWRVANIPLVNGIEPPDAIFTVDPQRVFGLTINPETLIEQRKRRVASMGYLFNSNSYLNPGIIDKELEFANYIFTKGRFTTIDVTNKPIESSANEILQYIQQRFDIEYRKK